MTAVAFVVFRHDPVAAEPPADLDAEADYPDTEKGNDGVHDRVRLLGCGADPRAWLGIEAVAATRTSLEADGDIPVLAMHGRDGIEQLRSLRAAIASERRRRTAVRRMLRQMARDATRLTRLERVTRIFCWIHVAINVLELFLGSLQGLGAIIPLLAILGMRVRWVSPLVLFMAWLVADLAADIVTSVLATLAVTDPAAQEVQLRGTLISRSVQLILVVASLYVAARYILALRAWMQPAELQDELDGDDADSEEGAQPGSPPPHGRTMAGAERHGSRRDARRGSWRAGRQHASAGAMEGARAGAGAAAAGEGAGPASAPGRAADGQSAPAGMTAGGFAPNRRGRGSWRRSSGRGLARPRQLSPRSRASPGGLAIEALRQQALARSSRRLSGGARATNGDGSASAFAPMGGAIA
ncbi:hypothetical protein FNF27_07946 [Cafeteria roenbergensis]|uniref:Uncharacterized protein n=1 Tax=Cafeteria roenbergensis TaxID=33653 RepID=A0A5A8DCS0_CAFRO|nr:hypothetical protein FNF27_07946 [Cafeteria roenbergensis]